MKTQMDRRNMLKWTGILSGATLLQSWKYLDTWDRKIDDMAMNGSPARLCYNENPFGPSKAMREAMIKGFDEGYIYPFQRISELQAMIAEKEGVSADHIVVTAGSREGLNAAGLTYASNGKEVIACAPTYKSLLTYAAKFGGYINSVPLDENLTYDLTEIEKRISSHTGLVFVCNPNNPTGTLLPADDMKSFCREASKRTIVFADEVYHNYIDEANYPSMVSLVKEGRNVIVARTFSKIYGLAGIRVGYLIARPEIAGRLRNNLQAGTNILAVYAAKEALKEEAFLKMSLEKNAEARNFVYKMCDEMGLEYKKSHTNFVFFRTGKNIEKLIPQMREHNVLIGRPFPPLTDWCRISTGKMEDMYRFGEAMKKVMA
ncbi:MAG: aminotransferase class I/II-fold pyridoxal phosphate-dependent enzyme [Saprospiraceae bacterium]|nr:aminotransferase class I/II-fold pyridoxal phosphate-dependent enzyme [Saprospiraceae bacterium]